MSLKKHLKVPSSNQPDLVLLNLIPGGALLTHESIISEVDLQTQYGGRSSPSALPQNMIETPAYVAHNLFSIAGSPFHDTLQLPRIINKASFIRVPCF